MTLPTIIIGAGAWGKALAYICYQANPSDQIILVGRKSKRNTETLPKPIRDNEHIKYSVNLPDILCEKSPVIIATPSEAVSDILSQLKSLDHHGDILCTSKGFIEKPDILYPHELYQKINPNTNSFAYLYGPTFADEILNNMPAQAVLASSSKQTQKTWQYKLHSDHFQTLVSTDLKGMAWCSVFKNIVAMISGCMKACKLGYNAQALLVTHATLELSSMIQAISGDPKTAQSIAGLGDIALSATSTKSRNFQYGHNIVQKEAQSETTIEGIRNLILMRKKLVMLRKKIPTIISLAEKCVKHPSECKSHILTWLRGKAKVAAPPG